MKTELKPLRDLTAFAAPPPVPAGEAGASGASRVSAMAAGLVGSEILKIAGEIRSLIASGRTICNLTVGDFDPRYFPIPAELRAGIIDALERGETNYPPPNGVPELRSAVQRLYERDLGLRYPLDSVLIAGGARPVIYGAYRAVCDEGDAVAYPVPSWNNNHYCHMVGARGIPITCGPETRFLPSPADVATAIRGARMLSINSPLNPTGTAISPEALTGICEALLAENRERESRGERPCYLLYDHVYWMLCMGDARHVTPPELVPEMARYTIFVDGLSKGFAATGLRVGWAVGPTDIIGRMSAILGHVGAWAPRAEQVASAKLLDAPETVAQFHAAFLPAIQKRLDALHAAIQSMREQGLPVESIAPQGAIYLTARVSPFGKSVAGGAPLRTDEDIRRFMLEQAGLAVVPFQAFGATDDAGWFRLSVGATTVEEIEQAMPRLADALVALR